MDPQRQYAQLLTVWSQGSKMFRRSQYLDIGYNPEWNVWWRLGRRLVERGLTVLPVPTAYPTLVIATQGDWFTLCPADHRRDGLAKGVVVGVSGADAPALRFDHGWIVSHDTALRLGMRGWSTLVRWAGELDTVLTVPEVDRALTLLGALGRLPLLFRAIDVGDWVAAAVMLRHPARRMSMARPLPECWGFHYDAASKQAWWDC